MIATPLLRVLPFGRSWQHGRTLADLWRSWKTSAGTSRRSLRCFALQESVWLIHRPAMGPLGPEDQLGDNSNRRVVAASLAARGSACGRG